MKILKTFDQIRVGTPDVDVPGSYGRPFKDWDSVPEDQLDVVEVVNDFSLFADRDSFIEKTNNLDVPDLLSFVWDSIPMNLVPNSDTIWVFFPSDEPLGFRYTLVKWHGGLTK